MFDAYGLDRIKTARLKFVGLLRRIWAGKTLFNMMGRVVNSYLSMGGEYNEHIPATFTAFGPNSLALGGEL